MPTLESLGLYVDLGSDPLRYPGPWPDTSGLLVGRHYFPARTQERRRLGRAIVVFDDTGPADSTRLTGPLPLNYALLMLNAAPIGARYPILAVGSNASPSRLAEKFRNVGASTVVPMFRAEVSGVDVAFSGHISAPGYVPVAPRLRRREKSELFVLWLDGHQLSALDRTEPNYRRMLLPPSCQTVLENLEAVPGASLYATRHGLLADDIIPEVRTPRDQETALEALIAGLRTLEALRPLGVEDAARHLAKSESLREGARLELIEAGLTIPDGFDHGLPAEPSTYDTFLDTLPADPSWPPSHVVGPTPHLDRREGQPTAILPPLPHLPEIDRRAVVQHPTRGQPAVLVRVERAEQAQVGVRLDQIVRNAAGVEVGDRVTVRPASSRQRNVGDLLLGTRRFVACRVQSADLSIVEQSACLLSQLTLDILGMESGDRAVIEGTPAHGDDVPPVVHLKAVRVDDATLARRESLSGGDLTARFPSARDSLGVHPDLPWIFLDNEARARLGLSNQKLGVVLVHAHRRHQATKQLRALALLLSIALIGVIGIIRSTAFQIVLSGLVLTVMFAIITLDLRYRLSSGERRSDRLRRGR